MQIREMMFVRMTIVHDLILRLRSTGCGGAVWMLKQPHHIAGVRPALPLSPDATMISPNGGP